MRIIALLNFFDERADWLAACVASLNGVADHIVAMDGAYVLFPQAKPHSGDVQAGAIVSTAQALGIGVTYSAPQTVWMENEVEKRNQLVQIGKAIAEEGDWFLVLDADMVVTSSPPDLKDVLASCEHEVGSYWVDEAHEGQSGRHPMRYLFRYADDLHITRTHYGYRRGDTYLWETGGMFAIPTDLVLEHRGHNRPVERNRRGDEYDRRRDVYGIENAVPA